jgi:hypothetical protein
MLRSEIIVLALVSLAVIACAPPAIKTMALVPAKFHEATKLRETAVLPFDGPAGREVAAEVEATLAGVNIGDRRYFSLVDRTKLDKVINEMQLSQSALIDPNTAANVGRLVGVKGIYTGVVTQADASESGWREERIECVRREETKRGLGRCIQERRYTVNCTRRVAQFSFTPRLIEVETGRVIYANNVSGTRSSSACEDSRSPLKSSFELIQEARAEAMSKFRKDVAPHYVTFEIKLMDSTDGITSKEAKKKFEQGIDFAKNNRFDRACELWGEARILAPEFTSIVYNLGICSEITGEFEQALDLYRKADRSLAKPDDRITAALGRVSSTIQKQKRLKEQLVR